MSKDITRILPDGDTDFDGEEVDDTEYQEWLDDWRYECNTYNY